MSNPSEDDWKRMQKLVDTFYQRQDCEPFRAPVPWKALGLVDYPAVIKNPMDLGTVKKKMKKKQYPTLYAVAEDVRLIWENCMTYNADGSDFYKLAELLKKKWDTGYNKLLNDMAPAAAAALSSSSDLTGGGGGKSSLQDKRNLAKLLFSITKEDLGKVLVLVEQKCPAALKRNSAEDEIELNIDAITASVLQEVLQYTQSVNGNKKKKSTKASSTSSNTSAKPKKAKVAPNGPAAAPAATAKVQAS